jgi:hypothetical protein
MIEGMAVMVMPLPLRARLFPKLDTPLSEHDASVFKGALKCGEVCFHRFGSATLEASDGALAHSTGRCKRLL